MPKAEVVRTWGPLDEKNSGNGILTYRNAQFAPGDEITIFGKTYVYQELLGQGGFGYVVLAKDLHGKEVVIKCLKIPPRSNTRELLDHINYSIVARAKVGICDGMSDYLEQGIDESTVVLDYVAGRNLQKRYGNNLKNLPFPRHLKLDRFLEAITVFRDLYATILQCEEAGVLHSDIKPDNVIFSPTEHISIQGLPQVVKGKKIKATLIDLDLMKTMEGIKSHQANYRGTVYGASAYLGPEHCQAMYAIGSDRYQLARVTREILVGFPDGYRNGLSVYSMMDNLIREGRAPYSPAQEDRMRNLHQLKELAPVERAARNLPLLLDQLEHREVARRLEVTLSPDALIRQIFYGGNFITV